MRAVVVRRAEDGYGVAEVPSLPGCTTQGKTHADAIVNVKEAIEGGIETAGAHGQPISEKDFDTQVICVRPRPWNAVCPTAPGRHHVQ